LSLAHVLTKKEDVNYWISQGLPPQNKTLLNAAILMQRSVRWPLIWDPFGLAARLLDRIESGASAESLVTFSAGSPTLVDDIVVAMREGHSVLITGVEDGIRLKHQYPELSFLLEGETLRRSPDGNPLYTVGKDDIVAGSNFRLYLTRSERFTPIDFNRKCCMIAFADAKLVSEELLSEVCTIELPDAEQERNASSDKVRGLRCVSRQTWKN
jgi:hypothetical protein